MPTEECQFCLIAQGELPDSRIVYDDGDVTAFFPLNPATRGHTLLVPHRHVSDIWGLNEFEAESIAKAALKVSSALRSALLPQGLNIIQSNGNAATQTVPHFHVHLIPRWEGDSMVLQWPDVGAEEGKDLDLTLDRIEKALPNREVEEVDPEDRRQHLAFIQAVITRMSQASSSAKTWLLPIVTAAYGYALTKNAETVALLGISAVLVFGFLDANYLKQEKAFRRLYDKVARGSEIPSFSMNSTLASPIKGRGNYWPDLKDVISWAIAPVYGSFLLVGVAIILLVAF